MNNINYVSWYSDDDSIIAVLTGQPHENVQIGIGNTCIEAYTSLEGTAIQSTGRDCGERESLEWAIGAGWIEKIPNEYKPDEEELILEE